MNSDAHDLPLSRPIVGVTSVHDGSHLKKNSVFIYGMEVAMGVISEAVAEGSTGVGVPIGGFLM